MKQLVIRKIDFLTKENVIYNALPQRMMYLRDQIEGEINDPRFTPWNKLRELANDIKIVLSDIYRSPAASAEAYARKTGVAKPGYSGHNYGVSIDMDIDAMLKKNDCSYTELVNKIMEFGWTPFQGTNPIGGFCRGKEDWHFNFIGEWADKDGGASQINYWITDNIEFEDSIEAIQQMLTKLKFYQGDIDGKVGPLTNEAIKKFKRAWFPAKLLNLGINSTLDELTIRTINIVSCDVVDENGKLVA